MHKTISFQVLCERNDLLADNETEIMKSLINKGIYQTENIQHLDSIWMTWKLTFKVTVLNLGCTKYQLHACALLRLELPVAVLARVFLHGL